MKDIDSLLTLRDPVSFKDDFGFLFEEQHYTQTAKEGTIYTMNKVQFKKDFLMLQAF